MKRFLALLLFALPCVALDDFGDWAEDATVYVDFWTYDSSGAPVAPSTAFEAADIVIYKGDSVTQKATANGLTMASPFDTVTGYHVLTIDTSIDTGDTGFWVTGATYRVVLSADETVDGQSVGATVGYFSIQARYMRGTDNAATPAQVATELATYDGPTNAEMEARTLAAASYFDPAVDTVANVTLVATTTTNTDMRGTDSALLAASAPTNFGDLAITATTGYVDVGSIEGTDATDTLGTAQTGDSFARLGAPAGASIAADIAAVITVLGTPSGASLAVDIAAIEGPGGSGAVAIDHNFGSTDALLIRDAAGAAVGSAIVRMYLTSDYGTDAQTLLGYTITADDGRFLWPLYGDSGIDYTLVAEPPLGRGTTAVMEITTP